jgi:hypothetical protein
MKARVGFGDGRQDGKLKLCAHWSSYDNFDAIREIFSIRTRRRNVPRQPLQVIPARVRCSIAQRGGLRARTKRHREEKNQQSESA